MKQFTNAQIAAAKARITPQIIRHLVENNHDVLTHDTLVPQTGCATWNHYFYCPEHSVRLIWDRKSPNKHRCPVDGAVFTGEPYYGAWWRWLNGLNAKACYELGILWLLTEDDRYLNKVIDILMQYARYYPDYQEHGGIPYNGPGKANAQTLCEANCHADFARGFDIVSASLSDEQYEYISHRLLRCGADFLMQHRCNQIHNHEVKINSTIGIIGILLGDETYLRFAVNSRYGLLYQLEHALLPGGLWFEGSLHYHYYALEGFIAFEKFAQNSAWSLLDKPFYRTMLSQPLTLLMPDMTLPKVNDCVNGQEKLGHADIYEFAFSYYGNPEYGQLLTYLYTGEPRDNIDALFYGQPLPTQTLTVPVENVHDVENGYTIIRNATGRAICIKHSPYGGEHDHYDRLNLIVFNNYKALFPDLGTTGYGAPLHYGYYKNTFSHNTLCVNGLNQPPALPRVIDYQQQEKETRLIVESDWCNVAKLPDSKTRVEWDDESYKDIRFRRTIVVTQNLLIDKWDIDNPHYQCADAVYHINAVSTQESQKNDVRICYPYVKQATEQPLTGKIEVRYQADNPISVTCFSTNNTTLIKAQGPNNPSTSTINYLLLRSRDKRISSVFVTDFTGNGKIDIVKTGDSITVIDLTLNQHYPL